MGRLLSKFCGVVSRMFSVMGTQLMEQILHTGLSPETRSPFCPLSIYHSHKGRKCVSPGQASEWVSVNRCSVKPLVCIVAARTVHTWLEVPHLGNSSVRCLNAGPEYGLHDTLVHLNLTLTSKICQPVGNSDC